MLQFLSMERQIQKIVEDVKSELSKSKSKIEVENVKLKYFGRKKGIFTLLTKEITNVPREKRKGIGTLIKKTRLELEQEIQKKLSSYDRTQTTVVSDITTPGKKLETGNLHPLTTVIEQIKEIFHYLGFDWADGPEVENDLYNFQKLNIPKDHPARDTQQTYYLSNDLLFRTHTSNMQIRYMEKNKPPIRALFPGRVYRREMPDATHFPAFFQVEGLQVDSDVKMTDLLGTLDYFAKELFGKKSEIRVYGHHFPYTEPSIEVEVYHPEKGWLEILGAGMIHPKVLDGVGINPAKYQGWAFGVGVDRIAMLNYDINDIRILFENDLRFLRQF